MQIYNFSNLLIPIQYIFIVWGCYLKRRNRYLLIRDIKTEEYVLKELIDRLRSAWDTNREIFSLMLEAEYEYYRNNDFNAAMTLFKRALEINNFQPIFISASEICSIENRFDVYEDLAKKYHYND